MGIQLLKAAGTEWKTKETGRVGGYTEIRKIARETAMVSFQLKYCPMRQGLCFFFFFK